MNTATKDLASEILPAVDVREKNIARYGYPYKFSIITAIYNMEKILKETIESVLNQTLEFRGNVQLILVNDCSSDRSGEICDEYARMYPDNIITLHKGINEGVAEARNAGLEHATGKYLNFLDSDDKFATDALKKVYNFFEEHYDRTDVVTIPMYLFGGESGPHWQNWKFENSSRVINLLLDHQNTCISASASFFKNERKNDIEFDPKLADGEDVKVVLCQLFPKLTLGVVSDTMYLYRRVNGGASLTQTATGKREWYLNFTPYLLQWVHDFYMEKLGFFPAFAQYTLLCLYQWRLIGKQNPSFALSEEGTQEYKRHLYDALKLFDDQYILEQKYISQEHKFFMIAKKYGSQLKQITTEDDRLLNIQNTTLFLESASICNIDFLSIKDGKLSIEGFVRTFSLEMPDGVRVFLKVNDDFYLCDAGAKDHNMYFLGDLLSPAVGFRTELPLGDRDKEYKIEIYVEINGHRIIKNNLRFSQFCPVRDFPVNGYFYNDGRVLTYRSGAFHISNCSKKERFRREVRLLKELWGIEDRAAKTAVFRRLCYYVMAPFQRKKHWIISDNTYSAGDNGEALFSYMLQNKQRGVKYCFAIIKSSPDYKRLKKTGKVIPLRGWRYKLYCLQGASIISSHSRNDYSLPFLSDTKYYADLFHKTKIVFLQHGVIKDDLSDGLSRDKRNIKLFVTATQPEYKSILEYDYGYTEKQVKLTGLPRHDLLVRDEKKYVTVMPTWRKYLLADFETKAGLWEFRGDFRRSCFYRFYHSLLNHEGLLRIATEYGYSLRFMPHPLFAAELDRIGFGGQLKLLDHTTPYRKVFAESDMIVTDYSSVAFDFAYLRKPLLYCQFDADEFFSGKHSYTRGYFDYERDGFGEIAYDLETTVQYIVEYIKNGCQLKEKYRRRIDSTFAFNDRNNCERVCKAIKELDRE